MGQLAAGESSTPAGTRPLPYPVLRWTGGLAAGLSILTFIEVQFFAPGMGISYARWPVNFLLACGELQNVSRLSQRSAGLSALAVLAGLLLLGLCCLRYWERLQATLQTGRRQALGPWRINALLEDCDQRFANAVLAAALCIPLLELLLLFVPDRFALLYPFVLSRYVAVPLLAARLFLPELLRAELHAQAGDLAIVRRSGLRP